MRGCNCPFFIEKGHLSNGCLQLDLKINSITLKKGMTAGACSKKHSTLENTRFLQVVSGSNDGHIHMYCFNCSFEITMCLEYKYLSNTLHIRNSWL